LHVISSCWPKAIARHKPVACWPKFSTTISGRLVGERAQMQFN
jgi:hypothetical protein